MIPVLLPGQTPRDSQMLSKGTNGEFGYLKSLDSDENEIWEVLGHVPETAMIFLTLPVLIMKTTQKNFAKL